MEPQIQYATTADGVRIAYYAVGSGPPLVWVPSLPVSHVQVEWTLPGGRARMAAIGERFTLIRYDGRGFGLSDRDVTDFSLDAVVEDLRAIADHLDLQQFQLLAGGMPVPIAIAYAARHPERVSELALDISSPADNLDEGDVESLLDLAERNWLLTSETIAHAVVGWAHDAEARQVAALMRASTTPQTLRRFLDQCRDWDVTALLPHVNVPVLIVAERDGGEGSMERARAMAAAMPNARLALAGAAVEGDNLMAPVWSFLFGGEFASRTPELPHVTAVMLLTDIADSTALTEEIGDAAFRQRSRELDADLRRIIVENGGTPVEGKVLGDGVMAVFPSARQAVDAALACSAAGQGLGLPLHVGVHAGDVIRDGANIYGGAVNIAARITGAARPGEVLVSDTVRGLARTSTEAEFVDRGEHALRGIADDQRLYSVRPRRAAEPPGP